MEDQNIEEILDNNAFVRLYNKGELDILNGLSTEDIAKIISSPIINVYSTDVALDKEHLQHVVNGLISLRNPKKFVDMDAELLDPRNALADNKSNLENAKSEIPIAKRKKDKYEILLNKLERDVQYSNLKDEELLAAIDCGKKFKEKYQNLLDMLRIDKKIDENTLKQTQIELEELADDLIDFDEILGKTPNFDAYLKFGYTCQKIFNYINAEIKLKNEKAIKQDEIRSIISDTYKKADKGTFFNMGFWKNGFPDEIKDFVGKYGFIISSRDKIKLKDMIYVAVNKETKTVPKLKIISPPKIYSSSDESIDIPSKAPYSKTKD